MLPFKSEITIGVLLATYNGERYLKEQLDSILQQSRKVDEIIISDDGSTDNTISIINEYIDCYKSTYIKLVHNTKKHGVVYNFATALQNASAELLLFCDQDDVWKKNKVEIFEEAAREYPGYGLYFSNATLTDVDLNPIGQSVWDVYYPDRTVDKRFSVLNGYALVERLSFGRNFVTGMSMAVRRDVGNTVFPINSAVLHDEILADYCSIHGGLIAINEETALYRQHTQNSIGINKTMFVSTDRRRNTIRGLIANSDQNMAVVNSDYYVSKYFMQFDSLKKYKILKERFVFFKKRRNAGEKNKIVASLKLIQLFLAGGYKKNDLNPLKGVVLDLAMIFFVSTKTRRIYFKDHLFD